MSNGGNSILNEVSVIEHHTLYVEEKALQENFGEYQSYRERTYKMFPYIY